MNFQVFLSQPEQVALSVLCLSLSRARKWDDRTSRRGCPALSMRAAYNITKAAGKGPASVQTAAIIDIRAPLSF